ncbi:MAG: hypothetical protein JWO42_3430 [Chloroflexi bacterium]|nr:hypothetical protein [Chloroflexota bacterium]
MRINRFIRHDQDAGTTRRHSPLLRVALCSSLSLVALLSLNRPTVGAAEAHAVLTCAVAQPAVVTQGTQTVTTLNSPVTRYIDQQVPFTVVVKATSGCNVPTGTVHVYEIMGSSSTDLGSATLNNGQATIWTWDLEELGGHTIQAVYTPDNLANFQASQSGYVIQSIHNCAATALLPRIGATGLNVRVSNSSSTVRYSGSDGVRITISDATMNECDTNEAGTVTTVGINGTIATVSGPGAGQPGLSVGDPVEVHLYNYSSNCFGGALETEAGDSGTISYAQYFNSPFNSPATVSLTGL